MVGSANLFSPEDFAELTTITASRYRARASRPSAALSVASHLRLMPQPPLLCEGREYSADRPYSSCTGSGFLLQPFPLFTDCRVPSESRSVWAPCRRARNENLAACVSFCDSFQNCGMQP